MLLCEKTELGEAQVTILPETYLKQQEQLATVIGNLVVPKLSSYRTVFYSLSHAQTIVSEEVHV